MVEWLLDTTFILPYYGIEVKIPDIKEKLEEIQKTFHNEIKISSCSLIEGKWKAIRQFQKEKNSDYLERANSALLALGSGNYYTIIDSWAIPEALKYADDVLKAGHSDYMDCLIAGTAKMLRTNLVTEDEPLSKILKEKVGWTDVKIYSWNNFINEIFKGIN